MQPNRISISLPSRPADYVPGSGPPLNPITLQPPTDSTAFIDDRILLPPLGPAADGRPLPKRMKYLVGWRDLPAARLLVSAMDILDYVSPSALEEWEYKMELELDADRARLEAQRKATKTAAPLLPQDNAAASGVEPQPQAKLKKRGRPPAHTKIETAVVAEAEDEQIKKRGGALSLSTPKKRKMDDFIDGYTSDESPSEQLLLDLERSSRREDLSIRPAMELNRHQQQRESIPQPIPTPRLDPKLEPKLEPQDPVALVATVPPMDPMANHAPGYPRPVDMDKHDSDSDDEDILADRYLGIKPQYLKTPRPPTKIMLSPAPVSSASPTLQPKLERPVSPMPALTRVTVPPTTGPVKKFVQGRQVGTGNKQITDYLSPTARQSGGSNSLKQQTQQAHKTQKTQQTLPAQFKPGTTPPKPRLSAQAPTKKSAWQAKLEAKQVRQKPKLQKIRPQPPQPQPPPPQGPARDSTPTPIDTRPLHPQQETRLLNRTPQAVGDETSSPSLNLQEQPTKMTLPVFKRRPGLPSAHRQTDAETRRLERAADTRRSPRREIEPGRRVMPAANNTRSPTPPLRRPPRTQHGVVRRPSSPVQPPRIQYPIGTKTQTAGKIRLPSPDRPSKKAPSVMRLPSPSWPPTKALSTVRPPSPSRPPRKAPSVVRPPSPPRPPIQQKSHEPIHDKTPQVAITSKRRRQELSPSPELASQPRRTRRKKNKGPVFASSSESDSDSDEYVVGFVPVSERAWSVKRLEGVRLYNVEGQGLVRYFKVRWEGTWPPDQNPTWEPEDNIPDDLVRDFCKRFHPNEEHPPQKKKKKKKRRKSSSGHDKDGEREHGHGHGLSMQRPSSGNMAGEEENERSGRAKGEESDSDESGMYVYSSDDAMDKKRWDAPNKDGNPPNLDLVYPAVMK